MNKEDLKELFSKRYFHPYNAKLSKKATIAEKWNKFIDLTDKNEKYYEFLLEFYTSGAISIIEMVEGKVVLEWEVGGYSGGSCWDDSDPQPYYKEDAEELDFEVLDTIVAKVAPNLNYFRSKKLLKSCITYSERTETEYYGNCTDYKVKTLDLKLLFEFLMENQ